MKLFILRLAAFGLFLCASTSLLAAVAWPFAKESAFTPSDRFYSADFKTAFDPAQSADLLILGNSKSLWSLDPKTIAERTGLKTLHLGYVGSNTTVARMVLEAYCNVNAERPKKVIWEVSWFAFNPRRTALPKTIAGDLILNDYRLLRHAFTHTQLLEALRLRFLNLVTSSGGQGDYVDFSARRENAGAPGEYTVQEKLVRIVFPDLRAGVDDTLHADFKALVEFCETNGIELLLFNAPEDRRYVELQRDREDINRIFVESADRHGFRYLDFTFHGAQYDPVFEELLSDSHHVHDSARFTEAFLESYLEDS